MGKWFIDRKMLKHKKVKFKLKTPYQELSGNMDLKKISCSFPDGVITPKKKLSILTSLLFKERIKGGHKPKKKTIF